MDTWVRRVKVRSRGQPDEKDKPGTVLGSLLGRVLLVPNEEMKTVY